MLFNYKLQLFTMAFKGTINTNGRPKGSQNKNTKLIKYTLAELLENNTEELLKRINNLSDKDYVKFHIDIAKMLLPKPTEVKVTMDEVPIIQL